MTQILSLDTTTAECSDPVTTRLPGLVAMEMEKFASVVADTNHHVLLLGEWGAGKDYLAKMIHSKMNRGSFVVVDCVSIPENLFASTLFGHMRGAFTGAIERQIGLAQLANDGTLFLNEIGEVPIQHQGTYLRLIEERTYRIVGGHEECHLKARIIAATNIDTKKAIAEGRFRRDLYDRLDQITFRIPPLRERRDEILDLINHFSKVENLPKPFSGEALEVMENYHWPGNIRELSNVIKKVGIDLLLHPSGELRIQPYRVKKYLERRGEENWNPPKQEYPGDTLPTFLEVSERAAKDLVREALKRTNGNVSGATRLIGMSSKTLRKYMS